ncbi:MAG: glycosyltransferase family 2 protein, partial [Oscillospiraceae bacterium]|nr:glycosyltransferase family 2 protein [Oscillospiraceae bacterium]
MLLTIIIPAWNAEKTLDKCLNSIFAQTVSDFEVRLVNDGSTDGTETLLRQWQARYPEKLFFETVENGGQGRARNLALEKARGEYIGFVDSDDWIEPDMFEKLLAASQKERADLTLCEVTAHFPDG